VKQQYNTWTSKREGSCRSLLDQSVEIFIGGPHLFPDIIPECTNVLDPYEQEKVWNKRLPPALNGQCSVCRFKKTDKTLQQQYMTTKETAAGLAKWFKNH
jgi:hypothetical protein